MSSNTAVTTTLHVSRQARSRYRFAASQFSDDGHAVFGDMHSVRVFAQQINEKRDLAGDPPKEQAVKAGQLNAMALIDTVLHHVASLYCRQTNPRLMHQAWQSLAGQLGQRVLDRALVRFVEEFPPQRSISRRSCPLPTSPARQMAFRIASCSWVRCSRSGSITQILRLAFQRVVRRREPGTGVALPSDHLSAAPIPQHPA